MRIKGILLSGGNGTRLHPITKSVNKQLLPVYDKPLIYYSLSTLMKAGCQDILLIVGSELSLTLFKMLLGDGSDFGINLTYDIQKEPKGIAEAFIIGEKFIDGGPVVLALGDNIFYGHELDNILENDWLRSDNVIFGCKVKDPHAYGVGVLDDFGNIIDIEEKPKEPRSNLAIPGLYIYDSTIVDRAKALKPSARGELEITDLSMCYITDPGNSSPMKLQVLHDTFWFDAGTHDSLLESAEFVKAVQARTGELIGDPVSIAKKYIWI